VQQLQQPIKPNSLDVYQDRNFYQNRGREYAAARNAAAGRRHQHQYQQHHGHSAGRGGRFSRNEARNMRQQQQYVHRGPQQFQYEDQFQEQQQFLGEEQQFNYTDGSHYNYFADGEYYNEYEGGYDDYTQQYTDLYQTQSGEFETIPEPPQQEPFGEDHSTPSPAGGILNLNPTAQEFVPSFMLR